ncbi:MAG: LysR family transcriptional regulator [Bdellovibrionota bacterium]
MIELFESLAALAEHKTVTRAAAHLRLGQSALSKRLMRLESELGKKVIEQQGRHVVLTPYGRQILDQVKPVLAQLRAIISQEVSESQGYLSLVIGTASAMTWAPRVLRKVLSDMPKLDLDLSTETGAALMESVASGAKMLGIVRGTGESVPDLDSEKLLDEEIVIVPSGLKPFRFPKAGTLSVMTVDPSLEAQSIVDRKMRRLEPEWGVRFESNQTFFSSPAIVQLARAGFGHGIVTRDVAMSLGIKASQLVTFPKPGLSTPVSLLGRKTTFSRPLVQMFVKSLRKHLASERRQ